MKKLLILLSFLTVGLSTPLLQAQCIGCSYGYGGYGGMYFPNMGIYPQYWSTSDKVTYGINNAFATLQSVTQWIQQDKQAEAQINARRTSLENQNSLNRMATEGIPAFAPIAPNGQPRSPKITWQDVNDIRP